MTAQFLRILCGTGNMTEQGLALRVLFYRGRREVRKRFLTTTTGAEVEGVSD